MLCSACLRLAAVVKPGGITRRVTLNVIFVISQFIRREMESKHSTVDYSHSTRMNNALINVT